MRNIVLAIFICALALGFSTTVYAYPSMGSDCTQCHGGGGGNTPGCGSSSGCNSRRLFAENQSLEVSAPTTGALETEVTEEKGFTFIHPAEMEPAEQVILWRKKLTEARQRMLEKIASWGVVVVIPGEGQSEADYAAALDELNSDSAGKFFDKLDLDGMLNFDE
jgi:hypothetical protein